MLKQKIHLLRFVLIISQALAVLFIPQLHAKEFTNLSKVERLTVASKHLATPAEFNVTLPPSYTKKKDKRYVLLVDFHPRSQAYLSGMHDWMSHNGDWPWLETIIVTPNGENADLGQLKSTMGGDKPATALLDFIEHDLLASIDKNYRTNGFRIHNGFTGNASLSLYTLLHRPSLFNAYFAASPILAQDYAKLTSELAAQLKKMGDKPRFLFISTGDSGFEQRQIAPFNEFTKQLQQIKPELLDVNIKRFNGSYYMSQPVLATAHAIELLFNDIHEKLKPDSAISRRGVEAILAHYQNLSDNKYGFEVTAEYSLMALAKSLKAHSLERAISVLEATIKAYPKSAGAHHDLAGLYAENKQLKKAVEFEKLALSKTVHPFFINKYSKALKALEDKL